MPATILAPLSGDTVVNPCTVTSAYTATATISLTAGVGGVTDTQSLPASSGGSSTTGGLTAPAGSGRTATSTPNDGSAGDSQNNITVLGAGNDPPIGGVIIGELALTKLTVGSDRTIKLDGNVSATSTALFIVAQVIEIDPAARTRTPVALGIGAVKASNRKWKIDKITYTVNAGMVYALRLFGLDVAMNKVNSVTQPLT